eukprot:TRINITY_DN1095_c8_g1_i1.p1 TRINITY_DN1095_c8_g1~~TRINITY_DN1095_c8_g1_i1.p1  ORF type:complete len:299 (+),score=58.88 TRINITY_DN1095_c8_g1_i1:92-988(+)
MPFCTEVPTWRGSAPTCRKRAWNTDEPLTRKVVRRSGTKRGRDDAEIDDLARRLGEAVSLRTQPKRPRPGPQLRERRGRKRLSADIGDQLVEHFVKAARLDSASDVSTPNVAAAAPQREAGLLQGCGEGQHMQLRSSEHAPGGATLRLNAAAVKQCLSSNERVRCWLRSEEAQPLLQELLQGACRGTVYTAPLSVLQTVWSLPRLGYGTPPYAPRARSKALWVPQSCLFTLELDSDAVRAVLQAAGVMMTSGARKDSGGGDLLLVSADDDDCVEDDTISDYDDRVEDDTMSGDAVMRG